MFYSLLSAKIATFVSLLFRLWWLEKCLFIVSDFLDVPVCHSETVSQVAVPRKLSPFSATCAVDAEPMPADFWWTFESAEDGRKSWDIPAHWYSQQAGKSQLVVSSYPSAWSHGRSPDDPLIGWLLCWAKNPTGTINEPCRISLMAEGSPQRPHKCHTSISSSILVTCTPAFDGKRSYRLAAYSNHSLTFYNALYAFI